MTLGYRGASYERAAQDRVGTETARGNQWVAGDVSVSLSWQVIVTVHRALRRNRGL